MSPIVALADGVATAVGVVPAWQLLTAIGVLASVVGYLFKLSHTRGTEAEKALRDDAKIHADKEAKWAVERVELREEFEEKHRLLAEGFIKAVREEHAANRTHEDAARREFAEIMENVAAQAGESAKAMHTLLDKFYDRFVGPRPRY